MNNFILYGNTVEWNDMHICKKENETDDIAEKCDFELDNCIPECIYKGPNTAVHLCLVSVENVLNTIKHIKNKSIVITDPDVIMKTCIILIFCSKHTTKDIDKLDNKLQSIRQIEKNEKKLNKWKKDNNYIENSEKNTVNLTRHYIEGYIAKHGKYNLPLSFRETEILSNDIIKNELQENKNYNLLMILEHRKQNSKPYGLWDYSSIGGGFIYGETSEECIVRETYEESGILLDESKLIHLTKLQLPSNVELDIENSNTINIFKTYI